MDPTAILALFTVLIWLILIQNLLLGIFLFTKAYQAKFNNLYLFGMGFVIIVVGLFGNLVLGFGTSVLDIFVAVGFFLFALFTYLTFHKEKVDYRPKLILYSLLIITFLRILFNITRTIYISPTTFYLLLASINCHTFLVFFWLGLSSFSTYKRLRDHEIAPWIKIRYKILSFISFFYPFQEILKFFIPWNSDWADPSNLLSFIQFFVNVIFSLVFIMGMILAWIIPKKLKIFLNHKKGYIASEDRDISEDELMKLISDQLIEGDNHGND
ncbi:MAG: hypothetical protein ACXACX_13640 [Candidatus Hodarchaeales archaeon]|jgi:hypothetical protein